MASAAGLTRDRAADFFGKSTYLRGCGGHTGVFDDAKPQRHRLRQCNTVADLGRRDRGSGARRQFIKALIPPPEGPDSPDAQPGPRIMHGAEAEPFQALKAKMEAEWTPQMMEILGIDAASLPIIWDADFLYGPRTASGEDSYVLCESNVSSVFAIPNQAPAAIARLAWSRLQSARGK
jgi:hypothetical protein